MYKSLCLVFVCVCACVTINWGINSSTHVLTRDTCPRWEGLKGAYERLPLVQHLAKKQQAFLLLLLLSHLHEALEKGQKEWEKLQLFLAFSKASRERNEPASLANPLGNIFSLPIGGFGEQKLLFPIFFKASFRSEKKKKCCFPLETWTAGRRSILQQALVQKKNQPFLLLFLSFSKASHKSENIFWWVHLEGLERRRVPPAPPREICLKNKWNSRHFSHRS